MQEFPEVDRAQFFGMDEAKKEINSAQVELLLALERHTHSAVDRVGRTQELLQRSHVFGK